MRDRVLQAARYIPIERSGTTDDCGFSPFSDDTSTSRDIAFAKIRRPRRGNAHGGASAGRRAVTADDDDEDKLLRSVGLQNARSVLQARQRAEQALREAQSALRESNERLQLALAAGHLGDWTWDVATDEVSLSERAARIFGFPRERVVTWTALRELLHEDDRERARVAVEAALAQRADYDIEYRVRVAPGELRWVAATGAARTRRTARSPA